MPQEAPPRSREPQAVVTPDGRVEFALSYAQRRLWFLSLWDPDSAAYNLRVGLRLDGPLDVGLLTRVLNEVVARHEPLRTLYRQRRGEPYQIIVPQVDVELPVLDLSGNPEPDAAARSYAEAEAARPFRLEDAVPWRASLMRLEPERHVLLLVVHHIAFDDWSGGVLADELQLLYRAFAAGEPSPLAELPISYIDYVAWEAGRLSGPRLEDLRSRWLDRLSGAADLVLASDRPLPERPTHAAGSVSFELSPAAAARVRYLASAEGATEFMVLLAAAQALFGRLTGQDDYLLGTVVAGRERVELERIVGFFVNAVVLRSDCRDDPSLRELVRRARQVVLEASQDAEMPFDLLVEALQPERDGRRHPVFQVAFTFENTPLDPLGCGVLSEQSAWPELDRGLVMSTFPVPVVRTPFALTVAMASRGDRMVGTFEYQTELFDESTVVEMARAFERLVDGAAQVPDAPVAAIPLVQGPTADRILVDWNATAETYPREVPLHQLVARQAAATPDAAAVRSDAGTLTYRELDEASNRLAHYLMSRGVVAGSLVAVCMHRAPEMVVALLGVLRAGAAYVPVDPDYPSARIAFFLEDVEPPVVLCDERTAVMLSGTGRTLVCLDDEGDEIARHPATDPAPPLVPADLAYVIFTSGSTGRPKGVMVTHEGIVNYIGWMQHAFSLDASDRVLQVAAASFDISVWEIFWPLVTGASVVVTGHESYRDPVHLAGEIERYSVTTAHFVPSVLDAFVDQVAAGRCPSLRRVFASAETLPARVASRFLASFDCELYNFYGATEVSVDSTYWRCPAELTEVALPVGRPISNTSLYVLDPELLPLPVGGRGEIYLGGDSVTRGYHRRPALTAERFVPDPFAGDGRRMYRTGDLGRFRADGNLEFLGRIDTQVKVRGFRIEPGEIELALVAHPAVDKAAVVLSGGAADDARLAAYVVLADGAPRPTDLRETVARVLPAHMVPSFFVVIDRFPLNPNGKLDRAALPAPDARNSLMETSPDEPAGPAEAALCRLWGELIGVGSLGPGDDFFASGGHSLLAVRATADARAMYGFDIPLRLLFANPTPASYARAVAAMGADGPDVPAPEVAVEPESELSFAQERLWLLDRIDPLSPAYVVSEAVSLRGELNRPALDRSLAELVQRHATLRTRFPPGARPVAETDPVGAIPVIEHDLTSLPADRREVAAHERIVAERTTGFDLGASPLLRVVLIRLAPDEHVLVLTTHHIAADGRSLDVLVSDLGALYDASCRGADPDLDELPVAYADYAVEQRLRAGAEPFDAQIEYWRDRLRSVPVLDLPLDHPRPAVQTWSGAEVPVRIDAATYAELCRLAQGEGATPYVALLALFQVLLGRYAGQDRVVVGTPVSVRNDPSLDSVVGFFVNSLAMVGDLSGEVGFRQLLGRTRETALQAFAHADVPFEQLVAELGVVRDRSRQPLFQATLAHQTAVPAAAAFTELEAGPFASPCGTTRYDLELDLLESEGELVGRMLFNPDLFDPRSVEGMVESFGMLAERVVADPDIGIWDVPLVGAGDERASVLVGPSDPAPEPATVPELVGRQARAHPDAVAVAGDEGEISYATLDAAVEALAARLRSEGVTGGSRVAVHLHTEPALVVAVLAVMRAGAAFVPLDAAWPPARVEALVRRSRARLVLTDASLVGATSSIGHQIVLDASPIVAPAPATTTLASPPAPDDLAYVMFTSGSTGVPNGVAVQHRSLAAYLQAAADAYLGGERRALVTTSPAADLTLTGLLGPLIAGGSVRLISDRELRPLADAVAGAGPVDLLKVTPSGLTAMRIGSQDPFPLSGTLVLGGEALTGAHVDELLRQPTPPVVVNEYGPTEATVGCVAHRYDGSVPAETTVPIGRPLGAARAYVLDETLEPVPRGVIGELCIGGPGVARGYDDRPGLTAERFVPDPIAGDGSRMYRSGDLARVRPDGELEFIGRRDQQVNLRGWRVELGEVEAALVSVDGVDEAVAALIDGNLAAFVAGRAVPSDADLRARLLDVLPAPLVPSRYAELDSLPRSTTGKVDRAELRLPEPIAAERVEPRTAGEVLVCGVVADVLGLDRVWCDQDFFAIGGHSLAALRLVRALTDQLDLDVPLAIVFDSPTLGELAVEVESLVIDQLADMTDDEAEQLGV